MSDAFDADAELYLSEAADAAVVARLNAALAADAALCERFVAFARLHAHLGEIGRKSAAGEVGTARLLAVHRPVEMPRPQPVVRVRRWWATAAAAAALVAVGLAVLSLAVIGLRTRALVPTVTACAGYLEVQRDGRVLFPTEGLRLRAGDRLVVPVGATMSLRLTGGRCELSNGANAVVEAADELHRRVVLERGSMSADLIGRALFAVRTPAGTIALSNGSADIDVGSARVAVQVQRGSLEIQPLAGAARRLEAGESWEKNLTPEVATR